MANSKKSNRILSSLKYSFFFVCVFWIMQGLQIVGFDFSSCGILPRHTQGLLGVVTSPFIHGDTQHLISNTVPFFVLCTLLFLFYRKRAVLFLVLIWLTTGILTWLIGREAWHIGASGIIYGLVTFLILGGILSKNWVLILVSILVAVLYSGIMWGIFPSDVRVSWEGHLSGAVSGILWAFLLKKTLQKTQ